MELMPVTIYTILQSGKLHAMYREGGPATFEEGKKWVSASQHLAKAKASGRILPIVFAPAEHIRELIYQGIIRKISFATSQNKVCSVITVSDLKPFRAPRPAKTQLVVQSTGKSIPPGHIRPYVICRTPSFIANAPAPNSTVERDARKGGARRSP